MRARHEDVLELAGRCVAHPNVVSCRMTVSLEPLHTVHIVIAKLGGNGRYDTQIPVSNVANIQIYSVFALYIAPYLDTYDELAEMMANLHCRAAHLQ
jgi:hypothetical protein